MEKDEVVLDDHVHTTQRVLCVIVGALFIFWLCLFLKTRNEEISGYTLTRIFVYIIGLALSLPLLIASLKVSKEADQHIIKQTLFIPIGLLLSLFFILRTIIGLLPH